MVFFGRTFGEFPLQEVGRVRGQGGELSAASRQLYPGHGTEAASVSDAGTSDYLILDLCF